MPLACAKSNTVLEESTYDAKPGEKTHTLHTRLMILFFLMSQCSSGSSVHPSYRMCFAVLFHRDHSPGDLSHPLSCWRWSGAMWARLQASVESDLGAVPLQP